MRTLLALSFVVALAAVLPADDKLPAGFKELYKQDFAKPEAANDFVFSDPDVWKYVKEKDGGYLDPAYDRKNYKSTYNPKDRSPIHIALFAGKTFTDFVLDCELQSTTEEYGHQDMCLFF